MNFLVSLLSVLLQTKETELLCRTCLIAVPRRWSLPCSYFMCC